VCVYRLACGLWDISNHKQLVLSLTFEPRSTSIPLEIMVRIDGFLNWVLVVSLIVLMAVAFIILLIWLFQFYAYLFQWLYLRVKQVVIAEYKAIIVITIILIILDLRSSFLQYLLVRCPCPCPCSRWEKWNPTGGMFNMCVSVLHCTRDTVCVRLHINTKFI